MVEEYKHWIHTDRERGVLIFVWGVPRNLTPNFPLKDSSLYRNITPETEELLDLLKERAINNTKADKREMSYQISIENIPGIQRIQFQNARGDESLTRGDRLYFNGWHYRAYELKLDNPETERIEQSLMSNHAKTLSSVPWLSSVINALRVS